MQRERDLAIRRRDRVQLERRPADADRGREALRRQGKRLVDAKTAEQHLSQLCRQIRLAPSLIRLLRTHTGELGDQAGGHGDHDKRHQRRPIAAIGHAERANRRKMKEVESRRAGDRGRQAKA